MWPKTYTCVSVIQLSTWKIMMRFFLRLAFFTYKFFLTSSLSTIDCFMLLKPFDKAPLPSWNWLFYLLRFCKVFAFNPYTVTYSTYFLHFFLVLCRVCEYLFHYILGISFFYALDDDVDFAVLMACAYVTGVFYLFILSCSSLIFSSVLIGFCSFCAIASKISNFASAQFTVSSSSPTELVIISKALFSSLRKVIGNLVVLFWITLI